MLIGCYTPDQGRGTGISVLETAESVPIGVGRTVAMASPSFLARHPSLPVLYAVSEESAGAVVAWSMDEIGPVAEIGRGDTGGSAPCHLAVDVSGRFLVNVNYGGGSVAVHRLADDGRIGERTDLVQHVGSGHHERQDAAHPHMVRVHGDDLLVTDLGEDAIVRYRLRDGKLVECGRIDAPAGSGPRNLAFSGSQWLVTAELSAEVIVYADDWTLIGAVRASRSDSENLVSELGISDDGRHLYVANRGPDTISVFELGRDRPEYVTEVPVGHWPRHITVAGDLIYCANQLSDDVTTLRIDAATGVPHPIASLAVPSPTCVLVS